MISRGPNIPGRSDCGTLVGLAAVTVALAGGIYWFVRNYSSRGSSSGSQNQDRTRGKSWAVLLNLSILTWLPYHRKAKPDLHPENQFVSEFFSPIN